MVIDTFIMPLQKDLSYDDMAIKRKNIKYSYEEKMIAKERKFASTLWTSFIQLQAFSSYEN